MRSPDLKFHNADKISFESEDQLRAHYESRYAHGGYEESAYVIHGVNISALYHFERLHGCMRMAQLTGDEKVLDAGCGEGVLTELLAGSCAHVNAVDIAYNALPERILKMANVSFAPMNVESLAFSDATFDRVCCVEVLEHLLNPEKALAEFSRVLKPGGILAFSYPTINRTLARQFRLKPYHKVSEHLNEYSYGELAEKLAAAGFKIEQSEGIAFDFGFLNVLKKLARPWAVAITKLSLRIRGYPNNSMFLSLRCRKL
jgi:2-polyprenyl-3-methyl-5-hydroxy-6-metoxy-1,4-benzoquinol methylase